MIQRVSDPFDDLVMDSNKSLKSIYKGSRRNGVRMAKRKKGMTFIPYDYEAAYNKSLEDMHEFFVEQMFKQGKKVVTYILEEFAGLEDGYCIMATSLMNENGEPFDRADLNQICADIRANGDGYIDGGEEYIMIENAVGIIAGGKED